MNKRKCPIARTKDIVVQELSDETLVYDLRTSKAMCLNKTSTMVWHYCDGKNTIANISSILSVEMKNLVSEEIVELALHQMQKEGLLENKFEFGVPFNGLSRREAIIKIGLSSAVVLPLIGFVVAPTASLAQSTLTAPSGMCVVPNDCVSGTCSVSTCCVPLNDVGCNVVGDCCNNGVQCIANTCVP